MLVQTASTLLCLRPGPSHGSSCQLYTPSSGRHTLPPEPRTDRSTPTTTASPPPSSLLPKIVPAWCSLRHPPHPSNSTSRLVLQTSGDAIRPSVPARQNDASS